MKIFFFCVGAFSHPKMKSGSFSISSQFKDTHKEKAPSNKTPALRKSKNMSVWDVGTLNQLFIRGS